MQFKTIGEIINSFKSSGKTGDITGILRGIGDLTTAAKALNSVDLPIDKFQLLKTVFKDASDDAIQTALGITTVGTASTATTGAVSGLGAALKGMFVSNPFLVIATGAIMAATAIGTIVNVVNTNKQAQIDAAKEAGDAFAESSGSIQSQIDKIYELRDALDSGTLTEQEAYQAKSDLFSIQQSLTESYGSQAEGIDLVNGSLERQAELLGLLNASDAEEFLNENNEGIKKAEEEMTKNISNSLIGDAWYLGQYYRNGTDESNYIENLLSKYGDYLDVSELDSSGLTVGVYFKGDAENAEGVLNNLITDLRGFEDEYGQNEVIDSIISSASEGLTEANSILEEWQDLYEQSQKAEIVSDTRKFKLDGQEGKTVSEWMYEYSKAVEDYNKALSTGSEADISVAESKYKDLTNTIFELLRTTHMAEYIDPIIEIKDQLNESAVAAHNFQEALEDTNNTNIQKLVDTFKKANMSDIDFKDAIRTDGLQYSNKYPVEDAAWSMLYAAQDFGLVADAANVTDEELESVVNNLVEAGILTSNLADEASNLSDVKTFSSLFESTDDGSLNDVLDNFQSKLSTIQDTMDQLSLGENVDLTDLGQSLPELAGQTDDLNTSLGNLKVDKVNELISQFQSLTSELEDPDEIDFANNYLQSLIDSYDFSDVDTSKIKEQIASVFTPDTDDPKSEQIAMRSVQGLYDEFSAELESGYGKDILLKLSIDPQSADWSATQWREEFNKRLESIASESTLPNLIEDEDFNSKISEYTDSISSLLEAQEKLSSGDFSDSDLVSLINKFPELAGETDDLEAAISNLINTTDTDIGSFFDNIINTLNAAGLSEQAEQVQNYADAITSAAHEIETSTATIGSMTFEIPGLDAYNKALESENEGSLYESLKSAYEKAKELYDEGLVGTDDFREASKLFSPNGMDDVSNFEENMAKIERYMTDDSTGVKNFLNDLESKGYATMEKMADGTEQWSTNISDLESAAHDMGMSFDWFMSMFGRLGDYGFTNDFFTTVEDGQKHIADLYVDLGEAEQELKRLEEAKREGDTTITDTVLEAQEARVNSIRESILASEDLITQLSSKTAEQAETEYETNMRAFLTSINEALTSANDDAAKMLFNQIDQLAKSEGIDLSSIFKYDDVGNVIGVLGEGLQEANEKYLSDTLESTSKYAGSMADRLTSAMEDGTSGVKELIDSLSGYSFEELNSITFGDGISTEGLESAESALDGILESLGLSQQEGSLLVQTLAELGLIKFEPDTSELDMVGNELEKPKEQEVNYKANTTEVQAADAETSSPLNKNLIYDTNTEQVEAADEEVSSPISKVVNFITSGVSGFVSDAVSQASDTTIETTQTVTTEAVFNDTEAQQKLSAYKESLNSVPTSAPEGGSMVSVDTSDAESKVRNITSELNGIPDAHPVVSVTNLASSTISSISSSLDNLNGKTATTYIRTVRQTVGEATAPLSGGIAAGTAHASGTAFMDMWTDYRHSIGAYAGGTSQDWALPKNEKALVNEENTESIVRDGVWRLIPGGAHIESLKKGDIIFNAAQTQELLKYGKVISGGGHGIVAHADGTAYNAINAYSAGSNRGSFSGGATSSSPSPSGSTSYPSSSSSSGKSSAKKTVKENKEVAESFDWIAVKIAKIERYIDRCDLRATSAYRSFSDRNSALNKEIRFINRQLELEEQAYKRYVAEANSVDLPNKYKKLVKNGKIDIETIKDEDLIEKINEYQKWWDLSREEYDKIQELQEDLGDAYVQAFDNVATLYDGILSEFEHKNSLLEGYIDQAEALGYMANEKYYEALKDVESQNLSQLKKEQSELLNALSNGLKSGAIKDGTEAYYDMQSQINDVTEAIQESETAMIEFNNEIRQIQWERFDYLRDSISRITDEADFLIDLMSNDKLFGDKGEFSNEGFATLGLRGQNYNTYMEQSLAYAKEIQKIEAEMAKNPYDTNLIERRNDLLDQQYDMILAAEDEKDAIKDLVEEGINIHLDALQELIDKYTEALDRQKDLYDFQNQVRDQTSEIASLEKQMLAWQGDTSEEGRSRMQQTQAALEEARQNLEETQYDRYISDTKNLLDDMFNDYSDFLNSKLENTDQLITDVIAKINENGNQISDTLKSESSKVGYTISDSLSQVWSSTSSILASYVNGVNVPLTGIKTVLDTISVNVANLLAGSSQQAQTSVNKAENSPTGIDSAVLSIINSEKAISSYKNPGHSDLFKYIFENYGRTSTNETYVKLANALGVSLPNGMTKKKKDEILKVLKAKGYRSGGYIRKDEIAWTQEGGNPEAIIRPDGSILMPLTGGTYVVNADATKNLFDLANDPQKHIADMVKDNSTVLPNSVGMGGTIQNSVDLTVNLPNVTNYDEFVTRMQHDNKVQKMFQDMTVGQLAGKGSFARMKYKFNK